MKESKIYDKPIRIYGAMEFGFSGYRYNPLSKEHLARYNGGIVLEYDDGSVAYTKVSRGVLNGVYVRYTDGLGVYTPMPSARGQYKKGLPVGSWEFNTCVDGVQVKVQVNYNKQGRVIARPQTTVLSDFDKQVEINMQDFRAPRLQKLFNHRLPTKVIRRGLRTFAPPRERED